MSQIYTRIEKKKIKNLKKFVEKIQLYVGKKKNRGGVTSENIIIIIMIIICVESFG